MPKNAPIPVPLPGESLLSWMLSNPDAVRRAIEALNLLISLQVQVTAANSTRSDQQAIVVSPDRYLLPVPLKLRAAIADPSGGGTVDTEARAALVTLFNYMRQTGQLPS